MSQKADGDVTKAEARKSDAVHFLKSTIMLVTKDCLFSASFLFAGCIGMCLTLS